MKFHGPVAQLVRAPPCHGGGHGFESRLGRTLLSVNADMAQLAEQLICNQQVFGSSPNIGSLSKAKKDFDLAVQACLLRINQKYFFILQSKMTE